MRKKHGVLQDAGFTVIILCLFIGIDAGITNILGVNSLVAAIFTLAVFIISPPLLKSSRPALWTNGV